MLCMGARQIVSALVARFRLPLSGFELDVDLELPARGVIVLSGASGSGKTVLMRCIAGLERAPEGFCAVNGAVWQDSRQGQFLPTHQRPLGYVFQESRLFPHLSVRRNLEYGRKRVRTGLPADGLGQAIDLLGIGHLLERMPERLSGGERQRVAIARALALSPQVLLMDEPLAALDAARKQEILPFLRRLQAELHIPVLYITHSPREVTQLADYLVVLEQGRVQASGTLADVFTRLDSPLAQGNRASTVLSAEVCGHEPAYQLTHLRFAGGVLSVPHPPLPLGIMVRLRIYARDVSLSRELPPLSSNTNLFSAQIDGMRDDTQGYTAVRLQFGGTVVLAHITRKAAAGLGLQVGMVVYAQVQGAAVLG